MVVNLYKNAVLCLKNLEHTISFLLGIGKHTRTHINSPIGALKSQVVSFLLEGPPTIKGMEFCHLF